MIDQIKIGTRVQEIQSGDWGVVTETHVQDRPDSVWVHWKNGFCVNQTKHIKTKDIQVISEDVTMQTLRVENALEALTKVGFRVTLTRLVLPEENQVA